MIFFRGVLREHLCSLPPLISLLCLHITTTLTVYIDQKPSYLSPGTHHPLRGRAALQVTAHPGGGPTMFGALGLRQRVTALPALTQDHTVPVARTTAGCALRTERRMKKDREIRKNIRQEGREMEAWVGAAGGHCGHKHAKRKVLNPISRGQQLY